jgi:hypothetical protein
MILSTIDIKFVTVPANERAGKLTVWKKSAVASILPNSSPRVGYAVRSQGDKSVYQE